MRARWLLLPLVAAAGLGSAAAVTGLRAIRTDNEGRSALREEHARAVDAARAAEARTDYDECLACQ